MSNTLIAAASTGNETVQSSGQALTAPPTESIDVNLSEPADTKACGQDDQTMAGRRSGEGLDSVIEHMSASARRRKLRDLDFPDSVAPTPEY